MDCQKNYLKMVRPSLKTIIKFIGGSMGCSKKCKLYKLLVQAVQTSHHITDIITVVVMSVQWCECWADGASPLPSFSSSFLVLAHQWGFSWCWAHQWVLGPSALPISSSPPALWSPTVLSDCCGYPGLIDFLIESSGLALLAHSHGWSVLIEPEKLFWRLVSWFSNGPPAHQKPVTLLFHICHWHHFSIPLRICIP